MSNNRARLPQWLAREREEQFSRISISLLKSPAYKALSKFQTDLYAYCYLWTWEAGNRKKPNEKEYPRDRWRESPNIRETDFFINESKAIKCGLITKSNTKTLKNGRKALERLGFIECVLQGSNDYIGRKSVFRMSERWKYIKETDTGK